VKIGKQDQSLKTEEKPVAAPEERKCDEPRNEVHSRLEGRRIKGRLSKPGRPPTHPEAEKAHTRSGLCPLLPVESSSAPRVAKRRQENEPAKGLERKIKRVAPTVSLQLEAHTRRALGA